MRLQLNRFTNILDVRYKRIVAICSTSASNDIWREYKDIHSLNNDIHAKVMKIVVTYSTVIHLYIKCISHTIYVSNVTDNDIKILVALRSPTEVVYSSRRQVEQHVSNISLHTLSVDIVQYSILPYLDTPDLMKFKLLSTRWNEYMNDDKFWTWLIKQQYGVIRNNLPELYYPQLAGYIDPANHISFSLRYLLECKTCSEYDLYIVRDLPEYNDTQHPFYFFLTNNPQLLKDKYNICHSWLIVKGEKRITSCHISIYARISSLEKLLK